MTIPTPPDAPASAHEVRQALQDLTARLADSIDPDALTLTTQRQAQASSTRPSSGPGTGVYRGLEVAL